MLQVFRHHVSMSAFAGMLADVLVCFSAALLGAASLYGGQLLDIRDVVQSPGVMLFAISFSVVMAFMYAFVGLYRPNPIGLAASLRRTGFAVIVGSCITYLLLRLVADRFRAEQVIGAAIVYLVVGLVVVRGGIYLMRRVTAIPRVLIIGTGDEARGVAGDLKSLRRIARDVVGFYPTSGDTAFGDLSAMPHKVFQRSTPIVDIVERHGIEEIIVAVREQRGGGVPMDELLACRIRGIPVLDLAAFYERAKCEVPTDSLKASWLVYGQGFVQGRVRRFAKRTFDIVTSATLLALASPLMLITMILIKLDSPGPVIYRQERVGLAGRSFMCLKFRSMRSDAEKDGVARWATKNDSRVTRIGSFLRKTRIDELPQLISVLKGEMSMVGPRPERPSFVAQLREQIPYYDVRHSIKPGVTGWAQVRYSYGASVEDARRKHQFDLYYVKNNSLFLDLIILIETVSVVLFREGQ